jgi:hypothetical protein
MSVGDLALCTDPIHEPNPRRFQKEAPGVRGCLARPFPFRRQLAFALVKR